MNLRKALDKAKQMRAETPPLSLAKGKPVVLTASPDREWTAPEYLKSCHRDVQTQHLMGQRCVCISPDAEELEHYKVLRTRIQQLMKPKGWNTLLITSPDIGDGKTLTAINLALTFSKAYNQTVMLVDCDLRRQNIQHVLRIESDAGIADYLIDNRPLEEFIIWPGIDKLTLISGGRSVQNSAEVLGSMRMKTLINEMKARYEDRLVILDSPPILAGADTLALASIADCILMVVKEGHSQMHEIKKALEMIPREKFLGYVMNQQRKTGKAYYY